MLNWWDWTVRRRLEGGLYEPLAEGASYRSLEEARHCAIAVARCLEASSS